MAWTAPRTWTDGELVTASIMNTHVRDNLNVVGPAAYIRKTADEIVNNSVTLQNDNDFFFSIGASEVWLVTMQITYNVVSSTPDLKMAWTLPASATGHWWVEHIDATGALTNLARVTTATNIVTAATAGVNRASIHATIVNSTTAGTAQFQWAQNQATVEDTTLQQNSQMFAVNVS